MWTEDAAVVVVSTHSEAEGVVKELQRSGFDMKKLSIIGKGHPAEEQVVGYYNTGEQMGVWGKQGAFWAGLWGVLLDSALFLVPGMGPVVIAGPLVSAIVGGLQGAVVIGGSGALGLAIHGIGGHHRDSGLKSKIASKTERFVVVLHGSDDELAEARDTLTSIVGGLQGSAIFGGLNPVGAGLHSLGIPRGDAVKYETAIKSEGIVVVLHGGTREVAKVKGIMNTLGHEMQVHNARDVRSSGYDGQGHKFGGIS